MVCTTWNVHCLREVHWERALHRDYAIARRADRASLQLYREISEICKQAGVPKRFYRRASLLFSRLRALASSLHFPGLLARLRPPASLADLQAAEAALPGQALPAAVKAVLLHHDGHDSMHLRVPGRPRDVRHTFLGAYHFYGVLVAPFLLPARLVGELTRGAQSALHPQYTLVTWNSWGQGGTTVVDSESGDVYSLCGGGRLVRACPPSPGGPGPSPSTGSGTAEAPQPGDGYLRWLEELVHRIESGVYTVETVDEEVGEAILGAARQGVRSAQGGGAQDADDDDEEEEASMDVEAAQAQGSAAVAAPVLEDPSCLGLGERPIRAVSLYPEPGPSCEGLASHACTAGVTVQMGCVFVPHMSKVGAAISLDGLTGEKPSTGTTRAVVHVVGQDEYRGRYHFGYRARMFYDLTAGARYSTVQLAERHWFIHDGSGKVEQVHGAAVVGLYPLLVACEPSDPARPPPFTYCSASSSVLPSGGHMQGSFTFTPGSMTEQAGPQFDAQIGDWQLCVPQYIFG